MKDFIAGICTNKYKKLTLLVLILIVVVAGFSFFDGWLMDISSPDTSVNAESTFQNKASSFPAITLYESGKSYEIFKINYYEIGYLYYIFDENHKVFSYDFTLLKPTLTMSDDLIRVCTNASIGIVQCRYFDINKKLASELFHSPITESKSLIVYLDYTVGATTLII